jgi:hypothetical protein
MNKVSAAIFSAGDLGLNMIKRHSDINIGVVLFRAAFRFDGSVNDCRLAPFDRRRCNAYGDL